MPKAFRFNLKASSSSTAHSAPVDLGENKQQSDQCVDGSAAQVHGTLLACGVADDGNQTKKVDCNDDVQGVGIFPASEEGFSVQRHGTQIEDDTLRDSIFAGSREDDGVGHAEGKVHARQDKSLDQPSDAVHSDPEQQDVEPHGQSQSPHEQSSSLHGTQPQEDDQQWEMKSQVVDMTEVLASHMAIPSEPKPMIRKQTTHQHGAILDDVHRIFTESGANLGKHGHKTRLPWKRNDEFRFAIANEKTQSRPRSSIYLQSVKPTLKHVKTMHPAVVASLAALERLKRMVCVHTYVYVLKIHVPVRVLAFVGVFARTYAYEYDDCRD
jgi:hypothetical protein